MKRRSLVGVGLLAVANGAAAHLAGGHASNGSSLSKVESCANIAQAANSDFTLPLLSSVMQSEIPGLIKQISTRDGATFGDGGGWPNAVRISKANVFAAGYPSRAYVRSMDRYLPDGTQDTENGGYWVLSTNSPTSKQMGAVIDGITLDTQALQALINYSVIRKCEGVVSPGIHLSDMLVFPSGAKLTSVNKSGVIKAKPMVTRGKLIVNEDESNGNTSIGIEGLKIDLSGKDQSGRQDMFQLTKCTRSKVTNNLIVNARWPHLVLMTCSRCEVKGNEIRDGIGHGIVLRSGTSDCSIEANLIENIGPQDGFDFGDGALRAYGIFLYDGNCRRNTIQNNQIFAPNGHGICFGGNGTNEDFNDNKVLFNYIREAGARNTTPGHYGIWIIAALRNQIIGNTIELSALDGIKLNQEAHRTTIRDNHSFANGRYGIVIDDADNNLITGNHVFNNGQLLPGSYDGIAIGPFGQCLYNDVVENWCYDSQNGAAKTQRWGIFETTAPASDWNKVKDNRVYNNIQAEQMSTRGAHTKSHRNDLRDASGVNLGTSTITANGTLPASTKEVLLTVTAPTTINLPVNFAVPADYEISIADIAGNLAIHNVIFMPSQGYTINGQASFVANKNNQTLIIRKVGLNRFLAVAA